MDERSRILDAVRKALRSEPRIGPAVASEIALDLDAEGVLTIEGEVANVAVKKLALEAAAAVPGVAGLVDRLRVAPSAHMGDDEIRIAVRDALIEDGAFAECAIRERDKGALVDVRVPPEGCECEITVEVADGVVILDGRVPGLVHKRLAGVLAWWVPGSRDVVNGIAVEPPEEDNDGAIADAVRIVLEKDPFVDATQIRISVRDAVVTLDGVVPKEGEKEMAEHDAWYVFGVDKVINRLEVRP